MGKTINLDKDNYAEIIGKGITVVDFWADWCGPCKMMAPVFDSLSERFDGKLTFAKCNIDEQSEIAEKFGVAAIPTFLFFKDGNRIEKIVGYKPENSMAEVILNILQGGTEDNG